MIKERQLYMDVGASHLPVQFRKEEQLLVRTVVMPWSRGWIEPIRVVHPYPWWPLQNTGFCLKKYVYSTYNCKINLQNQNPTLMKMLYQQKAETRALRGCWHLPPEIANSGAKLGGECQQNAICLPVYKGCLATSWCYRFHHRQYLD